MFWSEIFGIGLLASLFTIVLALLALVDILKNEFTGYNKLIWVIVVILLPLLGSILYFVIGTNQKITKQESKQEVVSTFLCKFFIERQISMHLTYFCMSPAHLHF